MHMDWYFLKEQPVTKCPNLLSQSDQMVEFNRLQNQKH